MIKYSYSTLEIFPNRKYYIAEIPWKYKKLIVDYCDLTHDSVREVFGMRYWQSEQRVRDYMLETGEFLDYFGNAWQQQRDLSYQLIDRAVVKGMKKAGLIEMQYKYKKKEKQCDASVVTTF